MKTFLKQRLVNRDSYWSFALKYHDIYKDCDVDRYHAPIDPFKILLVDPNEIKEMTRRKIPHVWNNRFESIGQVQDGDWDTRKEFNYDNSYQRIKKHQAVYPSPLFKESIFYQSMKKRYKQDVSWEDTKFYQMAIDEIKEGDVSWAGCRTVEEVIERCKEVDDLYTNIKNNGFKSQLQLNKKRLRHSITSEVLVDISRDGEFLRAHGRHRLAIAQLLQLDLIPVVVLVRHKKWMQKRDNIYQNKINSDHADCSEFNICQTKHIKYHPKELPVLD